MRKRYNNLTGSVCSLESDFLSSYSKYPKAEPSLGELEKQWARDEYDEKRAFKRMELEYELRHERD